MDVHVFDDPGAQARAASDLIARTIRSADHYPVAIGLSGGRTPRPTFEALRAHPVDWGRVDFWLSDERWVPWDDERSNGRQAEEALTSHVEARLHRPRYSEHLSPDESAVRYEAELRGLFPDGDPDLVMLGMGPDGHTASLFPGTDALEERSRWYVANHVPQVDMWRLTATYPLLWSAKTVLVLVAGEDKAEMIAQVFAGSADVPIARLSESKGQVIWMLDRPAASQLSPDQITEYG